MHALPISSAGRRFLRSLGFSLTQALLFGSLVGLLVFFRVPRAELLGLEGAPRSLWVRLSAGLEGWERSFYDWRARALGAASAPSDDVVVVAVDDETLAEARQNAHPGLASYPWPREIVGGMTQRLVAEGASLVLIDFLFPELSPRACLTQGLTPEGVSDDDTAFRRLLDEKSGKTLIAYSWSASRPLPPSSKLLPLRVRVGRYPRLAAARSEVQEVLALQRPAFVIPEGDAVEVWAGVANEDEGRELGGLLNLASPPQIKERRAADDAFRVQPVDLLVSMTEVQVDGLDLSQLPEVRHLSPPAAPLLSGHSGYGAVSVLPDPDGVVRGLPHLVAYVPREGERHVLASLPLAAAMRLAGTHALRWEQGLLHVGDRYAFPMDESGFSLLRWDAAEAGRGSRGSVKRAIPAWNVLLNLFDTIEGVPPRLDHDLEGKVVVLTNTSSYATDFKPTPIGQATPGGAVLAQALVNILHSDGVRRAPAEWDLYATLALAFLGAFLALTFSRSVRSLSGAALYFLSLGLAAGAYLWLARHLFVEQRLWLAVAGPLVSLSATFLLTTIHAVRNERQVREFVHSALGRYVSPEVARLVTRDLTLMRPERRQMTVYFSDIEGFTRLSEKLPAEELVKLLNAYLSEMTQVVRHNEGQVDKYIGDAVMAFWGAPVRTERHAELACAAALDMRAALLARQDEWERQYGHRLQVRAGLNSGDVVVGDMGSNLKSNYTVIGDAVNLASRLEGANKAYGTTILAGEATVERAAHAFAFREVDRVRVKGKDVPARVYELLGRKERLTDPERALLALWDEALLAYHARRFAEARGLFERARAEFDDPVSAVYAGRCEAFLATPPPPDWDGVAALKEK